MLVLMSVGASAAVCADGASAKVWKWHKQTVRYHAITRDAKLDKALEVAADYWNQLRLRMRVKRTSSKSKADIVVRLRKPSFFPGTAIGLGQLPGGNPSTLDLSKELFDDIGNQELTVSVVVHEMGHNLGLNHLGSCAVMRPAVGDACPGFGGDRYQCGPTKNDYRALKRLYRKKRSPKYFTCARMLERHKWRDAGPTISAPVEWSADGVNWSTSDGSVLAGSEILVRFAIAQPTLIFGHYYDMNWQPSGFGATHVRSCVSRSALNASPAPGAACSPVDPIFSGATQFQVLARKPSERIWLVSRFKVEDFGSTTFEGNAWFDNLSEKLRQPSAGSVTVSPIGVDPGA